MISFVDHTVRLDSFSPLGVAVSSKVLFMDTEL